MGLGGSPSLVGQYRPFFFPGSLTSFWRVFAKRAAHGAHLGIITLRVHDRQAHLFRRQLVASDTAIEDLFLAGGGVERDAAIDLHDGHGEGPILVADQQRRAAVGLGLELVLRVIVRQEMIDLGLIGNGSPDEMI
jgi:hypothetical protein